MTKNLIPVADFRKSMKKARTKNEENLQLMVCRYIRTAYPDVIFTADSSGIKLNMGQAMKMKSMKSSDSKFPDLMIFEPRGNFKGLFLELKRDGEKVYQKNGLPYSGHITEQWKTLKRLKVKGYFAEFAIGFTHAQQLIDAYMK